MKQESLLQCLFLLFALIVGSTNVCGQTPTTLYSETFGDNGNNNTAFSSYSGYSATTSMFTGTGAVASHYSGSGKVGKNNVAVSDYTGASGLSAAWYTGTKNTTTDVLIISGINISGYTSLNLSFGMNMTNGAASTNTTTVSYKIDNGDYQTLSFTHPTSSGWGVKSGSISGTGSSLTIKFTMAVTGGYTTRYDDIKVTGTPANVAITSIAFSEPKTANVVVGGTTTLSPTVLPANYTETVDWESDDKDVATVNSSGVVTGVAAGTAHIKAKAHNNPTTIYDECTVTVTAPVAVTGVSLKSSTTLLLGGTETLEATILPSNATNKNVMWFSADEAKVSVDEDGVITGLALTNGTPVVITVITEDGDFEAECAVTVNPIAVTGISVKASTTIEKTKTETLTPTFTPTNATNKNVSWESDDTSVATVSDAGVVTGVAAGTANITVTTDDGGKTATCVVTVVNKKGTIDAPYSVAEVIAIAPSSKDVAAESDVYVIGYIVGGFNTSSDFTTTPSEFQASNLALADDYNETTGSKTIPVEMKNGTTIRTNYNPVDNTYKVGVAKVLIKADVIKYFGVPGLKSLDEMTTVAEAVKVSSVGYGTWASDNKLDFTGTSISAYKATVDDTEVNFTKVNVVPADEGVLLYAAGGASIEVPVTTTDADVFTVNKLVRGTGASLTYGDGAKYYILSNEDAGVGFYRANGNVVAKTKAYLDLTGTNAKSFVLPGGETDGIRSIDNSELRIENSDYYNLAGQRVGKDYKGIVIVNGKKMLNK